MMDYAGRSMKAQMKDANRENAVYTLIVGSNELKSDTFTLRNMADSEEQKLNFEAISTEIKKAKA